MPSQGSWNTRPSAMLCTPPGAPGLLSVYLDPSSPLHLPPHPRKPAVLATPISDDPSSTTHNGNVSCDHTDCRAQLLYNTVQLQLFIIIWQTFLEHLLCAWLCTISWRHHRNNIPAFMRLTFGWGRLLITINNTLKTIKNNKKFARWKGK